MMNLTNIRCLLCGKEFTANYAEPEPSVNLYARTNICDEHSEEFLSSMLLESVWAGTTEHHLQSIATRVEGKFILGAWWTPELHTGLYTVAFMLSDGSLLYVVDSGSPDVVYMEKKKLAHHFPSLSQFRFQQGNYPEWYKEEWKLWRIQELTESRTKLVKLGYKGLVITLGFEDGTNMMLASEILALNAGVGAIEHGLTVSWS